MSKWRWTGREWCVVFLVLVMISTSGCYSFRKKFVRKKKANNNSEFIPVLEPIDYPPAHVSSDGKYRYHFSLWRVWSRDMIHALANDGNEKQNRYLIREIILHLREMKDQLELAQQTKLMDIIGQYVNIQEELERPAAMWNSRVLERRLKSLEKILLNEFKPELMAGHYN